MIIKVEPIDIMIIVSEKFQRLVWSCLHLGCVFPGPTFAAALSLSGRRQGSVVVYKAGQYPSQPLGPVTFLWRPRVQGSTHRQLWIWAHPTIKKVQWVFGSDVDLIYCNLDYVIVVMTFNFSWPNKLVWQIKWKIYFLWIYMNAVTSSARPLTPLTLCSLQDLLPELQAVCQCYEAVLPPAVPVVTPAEVVPTLETEPKPEKTSDGKQVTGIKRKRTCKDASGPPAKKILGDGTRSPTTPVTWRSSPAGIVIKLV